MHLFLFFCFLQFLNVLQGSVRDEQLERLRSESFDVLVIGGGVPGSGVALDAALRGLSVAFVDRSDFSSGMSCRSTKLIHGGVRYLEQAVATLDYSQYALVRDVLRERAILQKNAPHLVKSVRLMTPLYEWWEGTYYWLGLKAYDWISGSGNFGGSHFVTAQRALELFPALRKKGLQGGVIYSDGQFDDARLNLALTLTAAESGAAVVNYVEVIDFVKEEGVIAGVKVRDRLTEEEWTIAAKIVINASGSYVDYFRKLDDASANELVVPTQGTYLIMNQSFTSKDVGLLIPKTEDGRVLFLLPWQGGALVGTTEERVGLEWDSQPTEEDVAYVIDHLERWLDIVVRKGDVRSQWAGTRPLVRDLNVQGGSKFLQPHHLEVSASNLITIAGGEWTIYRKLAEETINRAVAVGMLTPQRGCITDTYLLVGAEGYTDELWMDLMQTHTLDPDVAKYLTDAYGDRAKEVAALAKQGYGKRLAQGYPYLEAEVIYAVQKEYAQSTDDVLKRRIRLTFLDERAAQDIRARVEEILRMPTIQIDML